MCGECGARNGHYPACSKDGLTEDAATLLRALPWTEYWDTFDVRDRLGWTDHNDERLDSALLKLEQKGLIEYNDNVGFRRAHRDKQGKYVKKPS